MKLPKIGLGITTWKSPDTLAHTLESYAAVGLLDFFHDAVINLQEASDKDREIARHFNLRFIESENLGIAESMRRISQNLDTDLVLFLENDCPVVESREVVKQRVKLVQEAFYTEKLQIFRMRHRWDFGEMFALRKYLELFPVQQLHPDFKEVKQLEAHPRKSLLKRLLKSYKKGEFKGRAFYLETHPEQVYPEVFKKKNSLGEDWLLTDSRFLNWTNQSCVADRQWFLEILMPYVDAHPSSRTSNGFQSPERPLNCKWWREEKFKIGLGTGLFTHKRFDGSWRPGHHAYHDE